MSLIKKQLAPVMFIATWFISMSVANAATLENHFNLNAELEKSFGYSMATEAGCLVFIGGIMSISDQGVIIGENDIAAQSVRIYDQLEAVLTAYELTLKNVVQETLYFKDISKASAGADIRKERYSKAGATLPSTAGIEIANFAMPGAEVELTAIAERCNKNQKPPAEPGV